MTLATAQPRHLGEPDSVDDSLSRCEAHIERPARLDTSAQHRTYELVAGGGTTDVDTSSTTRADRGNRANAVGVSDATVGRRPGRMSSRVREFGSFDRLINGGI